MTLLQIHEPGQTPMPHSDEVAVGIDLGTTHSVVAFSSDGVPTVLRDMCGGALVPSVVSYREDGTHVVGKMAAADLASGKTGVVKSIKRLMGRGLQDARALSGSNAFSFDATSTNAIAKIKAGGKSRTPVEISADILKHLKTLSENATGKPVTKAVITVPAYFDDAARTATRDAARMAGLEVLRLINEPTAAALAYGLDHSAEGVYAIYDLGGGTFDLSLLQLEKGVFQVLATGGDIALGGDDFDYAVAEKILARNKMDMTGITPHAMQQLLAKTREIKESLTDSESADISIEWEGKTLTAKLSRNQFEGLIIELVRRSFEICAQVLEDAKLKPQDVKGVVMVGGSTRIPIVRDEVERFFGKVPLTDVNPDEVVAVGAAIQAEGLTRGSNNLLLDVVPLSLGLETMGGLVEKVIHRNTPIPVSAAQEFTTYQDNQNGMIIHVLQGEREMVEQCRSLARFELTGIPALPAGIARVKVTLSVDADGLLSVNAQEMTTGTKQGIEVRPSYGLSGEDIERMLVESMQNAQGDIMQRLLTEARVDAERSIIELESAMKSDASLLYPGEADVFAKQIEMLKKACKGEDRDRIDMESQQLGEVSRSFAERRMNKAISGALQGQDIKHYPTN
jgi:molecular chaperone HscA